MSKTEKKLLRIFPLPFLFTEIIHNSNKNVISCISSDVSEEDLSHFQKCLLYRAVLLLFTITFS